MKTLKFSDLVEEFINFEANNNLFDISINGVKYWHLIRFSVFNNLIQKKYNLGVAHRGPKSKIFKLIKFFLGIFKNRSLIKRNPLFFNRKKDLLIFNHSRRVFNDGFYEELYTEPLSLRTKLSHITIENPHQSTHHFRPIKNDSILYLDIIKLLISFKTKLSSLFKIQIRDDSILTIQQLIEDKFEIKFDVKEFYKLINKNIVVFKQYEKVYSKILDRIKPKIILQVVSYSTHLMALNVVAKKHGIPVIEMQHGTMGKYHIAYNFNVRNLDTFPDYVFVFGEYWKKSTRLPLNSDYIMVTGWPFFENNHKKYKKNTIHNDFETILFISQGDIGHELSQIAAGLQAKIDQKKYKIIYKLHPGEYYNWKVEYPWLVDSNIQVVDNNKSNIHHFLANANYQVGVASTAIFEGLVYKLKTMIVELNGLEYMEDLIINGTAKVVKNSDEIIDNLGSSSFSSDNKSDYFFSNDSLKKNLKFINEIIDLNNNH